jgi:hypothetical protein
MKRASIGACTLLSVSCVFLLPAYLNLFGAKSSTSLMQARSVYEEVDSRKEPETTADPGNSMAEMSSPQDATWTDPATGLMWTKEDNGKKVNWNEANQYCRDLKVKDYSDWRLPTIEELLGIFDKTQNAHGYHIKGGIKLSLCCEWSSSTGLDSNQRWLLHFMGGGRVSGRLDYAFPVLCVRKAAK